MAATIYPSIVPWSMMPVHLRPAPEGHSAMNRPASTPVVDLLDRWGPGHCSSMSLEEARSYCRDLALSHGENFSVLSRFVPARMHEGMCAVYAFCRWSDDLGDETGDRDRSTQFLIHKTISLLYSCARA